MPRGAEWKALAKQCKANGICVRYKRNRRPIAQLRKLLNGVGNASPEPRMTLRRIAQRCQAQGIPTSDHEGGLLPKKFLHALLTMPPKVKGTKRTFDAVELCSRSGQIVKVVQKTGGKGRAIDSFLSPQDNFLTPLGELRAWKAVASVKRGGLVAVEAECKMWLQFITASVHKREYNMQGPGRAAIAGKGDTSKPSVLRANKEVNVLAPLIQFAIDRGCLVMAEQSLKSTVHNYRPFRYVVQHNALTRTTVQGCRYGWPAKKQLVLYHNLPFAELHLKRPCTHTDHQVKLTRLDSRGHVEGNEHMRPSAWYPRPFAAAIARAAWGR